MLHSEEGCFLCLPVDQGEAGDNMGALLRGVKRDQVRRGQVIVAPGSIKAVKKFLAQVYVRSNDFLNSSPLISPVQVLSKDEGISFYVVVNDTVLHFVS